MKRELLLGSVAAFVATAALAQSPSSSTLTEPQRARVQQNVLGALGSPRDDNAKFALTLGATIPTDVALADVTETLRDIQPDWRGRKFFVVKNTVVIVDQNRKISAVLPVGDARAQVRGVRGSTVSGSTPSVQPLSGKAATPGTAGSTPGSLGTATTPSVAPLNNNTGQASGPSSPLSNSNSNAQAPDSRASAPGQVTTPPAINNSAPGSTTGSLPGSSPSGSSSSSSSGSSSN